MMQPLSKVMIASTLFQVLVPPLKQAPRYLPRLLPRLLPRVLMVTNRSEIMPLRRLRRNTTRSM